MHIDIGLALGQTRVSVTPPAVTTSDTFTQGGVTFTLAAPTDGRQSADGAWVLERPFTVNSVTPASTGTGASTRSGLMLNPLLKTDANHVGQPWDGRDTTFDAATMATLPLTMSANDVLLKGVSEASAATDRDGWLSEGAALYAIDDLSTLPAGDFISASPIGWTGRGALEFVALNTSAAIAAISTFDTSGHTNEATYADVAARIDRWQGFAAYEMDGVTAGGYQAWYTYGTGTTSNYGQYLYHQQELAMLGLMGTTWSNTEKATLITKEAAIGVHIMQVGAGTNTLTLKGNGGHHQWQMPSAIMAMLACPGFVTSGELRDLFPCNQLRQSFIFDAALLARLAPHDLSTDPMDARNRTIDAISGNTITIDMALGGERYRWHPSDRKKMVSSSSEIALAAGQSADTLTVAATSFDVADASGFAVNDTVWFEMVDPYVVGDPAWTVENVEAFNSFDLSPISGYVGDGNNANIAFVLFLLASGLSGESAFLAFIRYQEARSFNWRGYFEPFQTLWSQEFWLDYGQGLFTSTIGEGPYRPTEAVLSAPVGAANGAFAYTGSADIDTDNGTLYWAVFPAATTPDASAIINGTGAADFDNSTVSASGTQAVSGGGMSAETDYKTWFVQRDAYGGTSNIVSSATFTTAAAGSTDLMDGIGDFSSATGWSLDAGLSITGGVLDINTGANFVNAVRLGGNRISASPAQVLDVEIEMSSLTTAQRFRLKLQSYDSGGTAIDSNTVVFDTNTDGALTSGTNTKGSAYTTPAGTASIAVDLEFVISGFVGQMDDFKLLVQ